MTEIALLALSVAGLALVACWTCARFGASLVREHARERGLLLDRLMHLSGHTWTPPPADQWVVPENGEEPLVAVPEQYPDDHDWES